MRIKLLFTISILFWFSAAQAQSVVDSVRTDTSRQDSVVVDSASQGGLPLGDTTEQLEHGIPVKEGTNGTTEDWLLWIYFAQLIFLGVSRYLYPPIFSELARHIFNHNIALQRYRHRDFEPTTIDFLLRLNALLTAGLLICFALEYWLFIDFTPYLLLVVSGFLVGFYLFRKMIKAIFGSLFRIEEVLGFTNFYSDYLIKGLGIIGLPILLIYTFGNVFMEAVAFYSVLLAILVFITARILGGFKAGSSIILGSFFHFILYICTLEIIPLLLLCKLFIEIQWWGVN